jgi:hypothetical protein
MIKHAIKGMLTAIPFVFLGVLAILQKKWCHWAYSPYCFDFAGYSTVLGLFFILFGILYATFGIRGNMRKERESSVSKEERLKETEDNKSR